MKNEVAYKLITTETYRKIIELKNDFILFEGLEHSAFCRVPNFLLTK